MIFLCKSNKISILQRIVSLNKVKVFVQTLHEYLRERINILGRQTVPDVVKKELLVKIQSFLAQQHNI